MSDLNLKPSDVPTDAPGTKEGYGREPVGQSSEDCKAKAQQEGGYTYDEHAQACWRIYGKAVKIEPDLHSIEEGFKVVSFNFRASGSAPPVPTQEDLPGIYNPGV